MVRCVDGSRALGDTSRRACWDTRRVQSSGARWRRRSSSNRTRTLRKGKEGKKGLGCVQNRNRNGRGLARSGPRPFFCITSTSCDPFIRYRPGPKIRLSSTRPPPWSPSPQKSLRPRRARPSPPSQVSTPSPSSPSSSSPYTVTPFDVVKTRLQTQPPQSRPLFPRPPLNSCCQPSPAAACVRNMSSLSIRSLPTEVVCLWEGGVLKTERVNGFFDAVRHVWRAEGVRGLWKGVGTTL